MFTILNIYVLERINLYLNKKSLENDKNQIEELLYILTKTKITIKDLRKIPLNIIMKRIRINSRKKLSVLASRLLQKWTSLLSLKKKEKKIQVTSRDLFLHSNNKIKKLCSEKNYIRKFQQFNENDIRCMVRKNLSSGLIGENDSIKYYKYKKIAHQIENSLFRYFNHKISEKYRQKYRDVIFNLRDSKNTSLNLRILQEKILPKTLITMTFEEMASDQLKITRQKSRYWEMQASRNDLNKNNHMTDEFKCGKCGKRKCSFSQAQTRSADEPMTTFITCLVCNNHWKC